MNDTVKGFSILSVTVLAVVLAFQFQNDDHWQISVAEQSNAEREALALQQQIIEGADPTETQAPTAAGDSHLDCYQGILSVSDPIIQLNAAEYQGVADGAKFYIRTQNSDLMLKMPGLYASKAERIYQLPEKVMFSLANFGQFSADCHRQNLIVAKVL